MAQSKQNTTVAIQLYAYNGGYRAFQQTAIAYKAWNVDFMAESDFQGSPTIESLTGFERGGLQGYRSMCSIDLNASYGADATAILNLLNEITGTGVGTRRILTSIIETVNDTTIQLNDAPNGLANDFYKGFEVNQGNANERYIITAYNGSTKQATLSGSPSWVDGNTVNVRVPNSMNVIVRISPDNDIENGDYYNLIGNTYGVRRELTIGNQVISLQFRGVERKYSISNSVRIGND